MGEAKTTSQTQTTKPVNTTVRFTLKINGTERTLQVDPRTTLLDALREHLGLAGSKKGCDQGQCGACTVHLNGRRVLACLSLAIAHQGDEVTTIEGLAVGEELHPMQAAFMECDGFQCGYCTPGQIMSAVAMLSEASACVPSHVTPNVSLPPSADELSLEEIRERMSGRSPLWCLPEHRRRNSAGACGCQGRPSIMHPFSYVNANTAEAALQAVGQPDAVFFAGGTTLLDLMKLDVVTPGQLVDINRLPFSSIDTDGAGVTIGANVRNSDLAHHPIIRERFPVLSEALLAGASAQLRNMASTAGNLIKRRRCSYYRDVNAACNKRNSGSGCDALTGVNRMHAVLGTSEHCIATHPSDMCVALVALNAEVRTQQQNGRARTIPLTEFYLLPGDTPHRETVLEQGELITQVHIPDDGVNRRSHYLKVRDRASYEFALASAAVAVETKNGVILKARVGLGGVGTVPWRSYDAEKALEGKPAVRESFVAAAEAALAQAKPHKHNAFKVELAKRTLILALEELLIRNA